MGTYKKPSQVVFVDSSILWTGYDIYEIKQKFRNESRKKGMRRIMKKVFWKCEICDDVNPYPDKKVCECCGTVISFKEEQRMQRLIKEEEALAEKRKKEEEEVWEREIIEEKKERKMMNRKEKEMKITAGIQKFTRISVYTMIAALVFMVILTIIAVTTRSNEMIYSGQVTFHNIMGLSASCPIQNLFI